MNVTSYMLLHAGVLDLVDNLGNIMADHFSTTGL